MAKFIDYSINSGKFNMDFDEKLLDFAVETNLKEPILRLYGWSPACVSLGRNQKESGVDYDVCSRYGIDVVRRATGGRALLHDKELTYSFVCPSEFLNTKESVILSYKEISEALILGMKKVGVDLEFPQNKKIKTSAEYCMSLSTGADLSYQGKKLIGSAQVRKSGYILQHGSILIDVDFELIKNLFHEDANNEEITYLKEINEHISIEDLKPAIKEGFQDKFNTEFFNFSF